MRVTLAVPAPIDRVRFHTCAFVYYESRRVASVADECACTCTDGRGK